MNSDQPTAPRSEGDSPPLSNPASKDRDWHWGIEPAKPGHDPLPGCDIGGVRIVRLIAEGGMGRVYEGRQEKPDQRGKP